MISLFLSVMQKVNFICIGLCIGPYVLLQVLCPPCYDFIGIILAGIIVNKFIILNVNTNNFIPHSIIIKNYILSCFPQDNIYTGGTVLNTGNAHYGFLSLGSHLDSQTSWPWQQWYQDTTMLPGDVLVSSAQSWFPKLSTTSVALPLVLPAAQ